MSYLHIKINIHIHIHIMEMDTIIKLVNMLPTETYEYYSWMQLGHCLYSIDRDRLLPCWIEASKKSPKFKEGECEILWGNMNKNLLELMGVVGIKSLRYWAHKCNPEKYKLL